MTSLNDSVKAKFLDALGITDVSQATSAQVTSYFSDAGYTKTGSTTPRSFKVDFYGVKGVAASAGPPVVNAVAAVPGIWDSLANPGSDVATAQISKSETIATSVSVNSKPYEDTANGTPFKDTVAAYAMISALGVDQMGSEARQR